MNEEEPTFIVDLIAGRLSPDEEQAAIDRIAADPALRTEYAAQVAIVERLSGDPSPTLTVDERDRLHASLKEQLHIGADASPVVARSRWSRWMVPAMGGLAVAAAVTVGIVVLPNTLSGNEADTTIEVAAAPTTTAAASEQSADTTAAYDLQAESGSEAVPPGEDDALAGALTETSLNDSSLPDVEIVDLDAMAAAFAADPSLIDDSFAKRSSPEGRATPDQVSRCLDAAAVNAADGSVVPVATTSYEGSAAIIVAVTPASGDVYLTVFAVDGCEELATTRR